MIRQECRLKIRDDGSQYYCYKWKLHKLDGPAIKRPLGVEHYCVDGYYITKSNFYENYCKKHD